MWIVYTGMARQVKRAQSNADSRTGTPCGQLERQQNRTCVQPNTSTMAFVAQGPFTSNKAGRYNISFSLQDTTHPLQACTVPAPAILHTGLTVVETGTPPLLLLPVAGTAETAAAASRSRTQLLCCTQSHPRVCAPTPVSICCRQVLSTGPELPWQQRRQLLQLFWTWPV